MLRRAQLIQEKSLDSNNLEVARTMWKLAVAYNGAKQLANAELTLKLAIYSYLNWTHSGEELRSWMLDYSNLLKQEQKYAEAEDAYAKANGTLVRDAIAESKNQVTKGAGYR